MVGGGDEDEDEGGKESEELQVVVRQTMEDLQISEGGIIDGRVRRAVMSRLRQRGYNAAICKSRWNHAPGIPAGDYEYMDVIMVPSKGRVAADTTKRYIIDLEFRAQFEIARASAEYTELMEAMAGKVFVGGVRRLKAAVRAMCAAAKRSLKEQGLHLPPWRKPRYMLCKWCAAYRRTTALFPSSSSSSSSCIASTAAPAPLPLPPPPPPPLPPPPHSELGLGFPALHSFSSSSSHLNHHRTTTGFRRIAPSSSHSQLHDLASANAPSAPIKAPSSALAAALKLHAAAASSMVVAVLS